MYGRCFHAGRVHPLHNLAKTCLLMRAGPLVRRLKYENAITAAEHVIIPFGACCDCATKYVCTGTRQAGVAAQNAVSSPQSRSSPCHRTIQSLRTFARWYDLIFGRADASRRESSPSPLCIARRWPGRVSAQTRQSQPCFRYYARRNSGLDSSHLTASLSQCELGDCAIVDIFGRASRLFTSPKVTRSRFASARNRSLSSPEVAATMSPSRGTRSKS